jgi:hypothetical protein
MPLHGDQAARRPLAVREREYLKSGAWKCENSPTGGHWWNCNREPAVCKICGKVKSTLSD